MFDGGVDAVDGPYGTPSQRLAWVLGQPPSAATCAVLESLADATLTKRDQLLAARAWDRQLAATHGAAIAATVRATTPEPEGMPADLLEAELALQLRRPDDVMAAEVFDARAVRRLPVMFGLLVAGAVTIAHARAFADLLAPLQAADRLLVDAEIGGRAATMTVRGFRRVGRRMVARLDRRTPQQREAARKGCIGVKTWPQPDGLMTVGVTMPATDGIEMLRALQSAADRLCVPDDPRTAGERQVEALRHAVLGIPTSPAGPSAPARRRAEVQVVIDWRDLLGLRDHLGELLGYGPVPAADIRRLLVDEAAVLRRLVTDPATGTLLDYGRSRYAPDGLLRRFLAARDLTCRYPGCDRNAIWCDDEHCVSFDAGGETSTSNCCLMCRRHHRRKTFDGFTYTRPDPQTGVTQWRTPLGFTFTREPAAYPDGGPDTGGTIRGRDGPTPPG
jgi:hypothetical protein